MDFASSWRNSIFCCLCTIIILLPSLWFPASATSCRPDQSFALLQLKQCFSHSDLPSWLPGTDCCRGWEGVSCEVSTGHVTALDLSERYIEGNVSAAIFNLTSLRNLNLAYNNFLGNKIPAPGFEKLTMLTRLNLSSSNFTGQVPIGIANLTNLVSLDLSCWDYHCGLRLRIPTLHTLVSNLSNLRELHLDYVDVSENGTEWCGALSDSVPLLHILSMSGCNLSGPIEPSLSRLNSLVVIDLGGNRFNSPIPDYFADFPLKDLQLNGCNITGLFPTKIFQSPTLTHLDLFRNENLLVTIPEFPLESSLERLVLADTTLFGSIPDSIGNLRNLSFLSLQSCNISGQIPSYFTKLDKLETLDLSFNSLSGSIPQALFTLPNLKILGLGHNKLSGEFRLDEVSPIPISPLIELYLGGNQLNGSIPQVIYKFSKLEILILASNQFIGPIPNSIFGLSSLRGLYLNSNKFNGTIELSLVQHLSNLTELSLSYNQLSILEDLSQEQLQLAFPKITFLGLALCKLSQIPLFLRYRSNLTVVDLSNNHLKGVIPSWLWEKFTSNSLYENSLNLSRNMFTSVEHVNPQCSGPSSSCRYFYIIDLSYNKIKGSLPLIIGYNLDYSNNEFSEIPSNYTLYLKYNVFLRLTTNRLTGELPSSICERPTLFLDISDNKLSGLIPSCILEAPNLQFLNLASNKFQGIVPRNTSKSCELMILNLSNNNLEGGLPRSLTRCKNLVLLDIGNNHISDIFPFWLWELSNLQVIILRFNHLHGALELPPRLASNSSLFQNMRIIDLASNNLNGSLPSSLFKNLKSMANSSLNELTSSTFIASIHMTYYDTDEKITIIDKGIQMIMEEHIASLMVGIDLSNNKFTGNIPETIGMLSTLRALNLSHNVFSGSIPRSFKSLVLMESLDLSWNSLSGEIPQELSSIDSLSKLNLSFNHLVGRIPQSPHFLTFDKSSFEGNLELCGVPLSKLCNVTSPKNNLTIVPTTNAKQMTAIVFLCLFIGLGFGTGLAIVIVWPIIKRAVKG